MCNVHRLFIQIEHHCMTINTILGAVVRSAEKRWRGCQTVQQLKAEGNVHACTSNYNVSKVA